MRIGEVHTLLRQDYPDIELSKIRYYEDKGLVQPGRSRKGYRLYSERDVACLREAIRLAQEEFVPLRVVRLRLVEQGLLDDVASTPVTRQVAREAVLSSVSIPVPSVAAIDPAPARPALSVVENAPTASAKATSANGGTLYTTQEFLKAVDIDDATVNHLISLGLLVPTSSAGDTVFSELDVQVARCAGPLVARGIDERFLGSLRRIVEREIGVLEDLTEPLRSPANRLSVDQTREVVGTVAAEMEALRAVLLERALQDYLGR
jgi:DNA-binding transcriptional MerR regulator